VAPLIVTDRQSMSEARARSKRVFGLKRKER